MAKNVWNMVVKGISYVNPEGYLFPDPKRKPGLVKRIRKQIDKFGLIKTYASKLSQFEGFYVR